MKRIVVFSCALGIVFVLLAMCFLCFNNSEIEKPENVDEYQNNYTVALPVQVYYEGALYSHTGECVYAIPNNFYYIGKINYV